MTRYLVSDENPGGLKLEAILDVLRGEIINRCTKITGDHSPQAQQVLANNMRILNLLTDAIQLAEESSKTLDNSFGPSRADEGGPPRIGVA
ncbi:MAG: histidine kinase [Pseudomonadota bacterium]